MWGLYADRSVCQQQISQTLCGLYDNAKIYIYKQDKKRARQILVERQTCARPVVQA